MIGPLFGNRNIERVLFFLLVNQKCYATQLQTLLGIALSPVQKALSRLEKEGLLVSHYEGKTRVYQFDPNYPLQEEIESLLRKAYAHLPAKEKRSYCFIHKPRLTAIEEGQREKDRTQHLIQFWERLSKVRYLSLNAKSLQGGTKIGKAEVVVSSIGSSVLVFQEKGYWFQGSMPETSFSNIFRWTLDFKTSLASLEHLRYGEGYPIFLFHLTPTESSLLESIDAHLCAEDVYMGNIHWNAERIDFHWRIIGPRKNDELIYRYT